MKSSTKSGFDVLRHSRAWAIALMALIVVAIMSCAVTAFAAPESSSTKAASSSSSQTVSTTKDSSSSASASSSESSAASSSSSTDATSSAAALTGTEGTAVDANLYANQSDGFPLGYDLFVVGDSVGTANSEVYANLFTAGRTINVNQTSIGTDGFISGQTIEMSEVTAANSLYIAGYNITISGTTARELFAAGNNVNISADATNAQIYGKTVYLKGTYEGTVKVEAETVVVDPYLVVNGELDITADSEPSIATTATIASYNFTPADSGSIFTTSGSADIGSEAWLKALLVTFLTLLVSLIFLLLVLPTRAVNKTGSIIRNRPIQTFIGGMLAIIVIPAAIIGLFIAQIGWPVATFLLALLVATAFISVPYGALALGRAFLHGINKWVSTLLFMILFALLLSLPIVEFVLIVLCVIIAWGSAIQAWWIWRRGIELEDEFDDGPDGGEFVVPRGNHAQVAAPAETTGSQPAVPRYQVPSNIPRVNQQGNDAGNTQGWDYPTNQR